jgi:hypothetical protein
MRPAFAASTLSVLAALIPLAACVPPLPGSDDMLAGGTGTGTGAVAGTGQSTGAAGTAGSAGSPIGGGPAGAAGSPFIFVDDAGVMNNLAVASRYVYWADGKRSAVMKASSSSPILLAPGRFNENTRVGVDAESVYWSAGVGQYATDIIKTNVDGGPPTTIASGPDIVEAFAVGRDAVYWTTNTGKIWKVGLAGGEPTLVTQSGSPTEIAVDAANVYWLSPGGIMKVGVSGGPQRQLAPDQVASFAIDATNVYWVNGVGRLMKVGIDGGAPELAYVTPNPAVSVAADASGVYWTDVSGMVFRGVSPTGVRPVGTSDPGVIAFGIALDVESVYWIAGGSIFRAPK